jgi:hypothetical protein
MASANTRASDTCTLPDLRSATTVIVSSVYANIQRQVLSELLLVFITGNENGTFMHYFHEWKLRSVYVYSHTTIVVTVYSLIDVLIDVLIIVSVVVAGYA